MAAMRQIAFYGKRGIGKSGTLKNTLAAGDPAGWRSMTERGN